MGKNVALVLSGGGARGYAHIGAIKVLQKNGYNITSVAGTSMGALVGGILASGQLQQFEEWILSLDIREVLKLTDFTFSRKGLVKGKKVFERIKQIVPVRNIEDLLIPYCAVATDIIHGKETVFTRGDLFDAIRASVSIPTVFLPLRIDDNFYVDGGLLNPVPVNRVKRHKGDLLIVVDVNALVPYDKMKMYPEPVPDKTHVKKIEILRRKFHNVVPDKKSEDISMINLTHKSIMTMMRKISDLTLEKYHPDLLINVSQESFNIYDFYKAASIIKEGERATMEALQRMEDPSASTPLSMTHSSP